MQWNLYSAKMTVLQAHAGGLQQCREAQRVLHVEQEIAFDSMQGSS